MTRAGQRTGMCVQNGKCDAFLIQTGNCVRTQINRSQEKWHCVRATTRTGAKNSSWQCIKKATAGVAGQRSRERLGGTPWKNPQPVSERKREGRAEAAVTSIPLLEDVTAAFRQLLFNDRANAISPQYRCQLPITCQFLEYHLVQAR